MQILKSIDELILYNKKIFKTKGFVPTMGALHQGHLALIKRSIDENENTVVSIFVNPTQFLEGEDFTKYPRTIKKDIEICKKAGVDALFLPNIDDIYEKDELSIKAPKIKGYILEGYNRPTHFDGVLQIVLKLLNLINPTNAYFGKKDAQQLYLISKMVRELFLKVNIIPCEIVRDEEGLALSSRNLYLSTQERQRALKISASLKKASNMVIKGILSTKEIKNEIYNILKDEKIEYIEIVDREFNLIDKIEIKNTIILIALKIGTTRLIDNIWL